MTPASEWRAPRRRPLPPVFTMFWIPNCQVPRVLWHRLHDVVSSHGTLEGQLQLSLLTRGKSDGAWDPGKGKALWNRTCWDPHDPSPAGCFLCSSKRSAELMEELVESLSSRARVSN